MGFSLNPVGGYWFVAIAAAVLLALCAVRPTLAISRNRWRTLITLRLLATLLLLLAMLRPEIVQTRKETLRAALLVLIDSSKSMTVQDSLGGLSRWASAVKLLGQAEDSLDKLAESCDIRAFEFDSTLRPTELDKLGEQPSGGDATTLGQSLTELLENEAAERLLGVVLLSDGAQRAPPSVDVPPQAAARRYAVEGVPILPFTFGTPVGGADADLAVEDFVASDSVFADTPTEVTGMVRVRGYANQTLTVRLMWEDDQGELQPVDAVQVDAGPTGGAFPIRLKHTPSGLGERKVRLVVDPQEGESLTTNNQQTTYVTVREGGVRVLYLAGAKRIGGLPGIEQKFVRGALGASPDIDVTLRVIKYRPSRINLTQELAANNYDVLLLEDLDRDALDRDSWIDIADRVRRGAGLMMTGGFHSFGAGGHAGSPLAGVLPITPGRLERQRFGEPLRKDVHLLGAVKLRPARPFGLRHPVMQVSTDRNQAWQQLPPLDGANRFNRQTLKANAQVLAESDTQEAWPLLVAGQPGEGRALAFAGDSTWRWQMEGQGELHRRFWRQAILWLAQKDESKANPVWIDLAARRLPRGVPLELTVGANLSEENRAGLIEFKTSVTRPDGSMQGPSLSIDATEADGEFRGTDLTGEYTVRVEALAGGEPLGEATARFLVPDADLELDRPGAEPSVMAQLAQITADVGGRSLAPEELPELLAELASRDPRVQEDVVARISYWDKWPFFLLLVGTLCVEWFLRKRWGLV